MKNPVVLVTGATSGIGEAIARKLPDQGYVPILLGRRSSRLKEIHRELNRGSYYSCDITNEAEVKQVVEEIIQTYGRIDVLINNAGYGCFGGFLDVSPDDYRGMMETNYLGAVRMVRHVLPHMLRAGHGRIINIASLAGLTGIPNLAGYCASKFALIGFSEALKLEYAPVIQVGVLCPGPVMTPFFRGEDPRRHFPPLIAGQMLEAEEVARCALKIMKRPKTVVIPGKLKWALQLRKWFPSLYFWATRRIYRKLDQNPHKRPSHSISEF
jgi:uncharacterized protein